MEDKRLSEIIRIKKAKNYVVMDKGFFEDKRLSFKAKGILGYLLSRPDNWKVIVADLVEQSTDGKSAVYSALKELKECGYYKKVPIRNEEGSRIVRWESTIYEVPEEATVDQNEQVLSTDFLHTDFQEVENQFIENRERNKYINKINNTKTNKEYCASQDAPRTLDNFFEVLWNVYPRKRGKAKISLAQKKLLKDIGLEHMLRAIERYKSELKVESWKQAKNGDTFFTVGYVDYLDDNYVPSSPPRAKPANTFTNFTQRTYDPAELERMLLCSV